MSHLRQQIRSAVVTACTNLTLTGTNVFQHHIYPFEDTQLPCLNVFISGDEVDVDNLDMGIPEDQIRDFTVTVEARVKENSTYMATLDDICVNVEVALADVAAIRAITKSFAYRGTEYTIESEAEKAVGLAVMTYEGAYSVASTDPENFLP